MPLPRYSNLETGNRVKTLSNFLRWRYERMRKRKNNASASPKVPAHKTDLLQTSFEGLELTWIGHSTFLIRLGSAVIVTDPVWSLFVGFEKRMSDPGVSLSALPKIDYVLISHNHYDHLSFPSIKRLKGDPACFIPKGLSPLFGRKGITRHREFAWWDQIETDEFHFVFVPAQHWSRRTLWDRNRSLWGGWIVKDKRTGTTVYFAGDTAYFNHFRTIGRLIDIDAALMPIGAYEPEWYMTVYHMTPEQAIRGFLDTGSRVMIPMHFGAYRIADDTQEEALDRLLKEWERQGLDPARLKLPQLGGSCTIP